MLNLAVLTVGFSAAYVGWDKVDLSKARFRAIEQETSKSVYDAIKHAKDALKRFDYPGTNEFDLRPSGLTIAARFPFLYKLKIYVLSQIAGIAVQVGWFRPVFYVCSQFYIPLLFYYRQRRDMTCARILTMVSLFLFLMVTAATVWQIDFIDNHGSAEVIFVLLSAILVWTIVTNILAYRISDIEHMSRSLTESIDLLLNRIVEDLMRNQENPTS